MINEYINYKTDQKVFDFIIGPYKLKNKIVESCPVPIVMAGGKKIDEKDALMMTENAIKEGASGVDMGRNIFQSNNPKAMMKAIKAVVHEGATAAEAYKIFSSN